MHLTECRSLPASYRPAISDDRGQFVRDIIIIIIIVVVIVVNNSRLTTFRSPTFVVRSCERIRSSYTQAAENNQKSTSRPRRARRTRE